MRVVSMGHIGKACDVERGWERDGTRKAGVNRGDDDQQARLLETAGDASNKHEDRRAPEREAGHQRNPREEACTSALSADGGQTGGETERINSPNKEPREGKGAETEREGRSTERPEPGGGEGVRAQGSKAMFS